MAVMSLATEVVTEKKHSKRFTRIIEDFLPQRVEYFSIKVNLYLFTKINPNNILF